MGFRNYSSECFKTIDSSSYMNDRHITLKVTQFAIQTAKIRNNFIDFTLLNCKSDNVIWFDYFHCSFADLCFWWEWTNLSISGACSIHLFLALILLHSLSAMFCDLFLKNPLKICISLYVLIWFICSKLCYNLKRNTQVSGQLSLRSVYNVLSNRN